MSCIGKDTTVKYPWLSSTQLNTLTFRTLLLLFGIDAQLIPNDSIMPGVGIEIHFKYEICRT